MARVSNFQKISVTFKFIGNRNYNNMVMETFSYNSEFIQLCMQHSIQCLAQRTYSMRAEKPYMS